MKHLLICAVLLFGSCHSPGPQTVPEPGRQTNRIRDGSVLFWRNGFLVRPILKHTGSTLTHAAVILYVNQEPWVYEAVPPRVHKVPLADYLASLEAKRHRHPRSGFTWFIIQPQFEYTPQKLLAMKRHAESQLGRPYMLRGWWKGREVRGIFCSQYVGDVIEQSGKMVSAHFWESPISLYRKLSQFYK